MGGESDEPKALLKEEHQWRVTGDTSSRGCELKAMSYALVFNLDGRHPGKVGRSATQTARTVYNCNAPTIMDATHVAGGRRVCLKRIVLPTEQSTELQITRSLSSEPRQKVPRNHAVPLLDVLRAPDHYFLVFPLCRLHSPQ